MPQNGDSLASVYMGFRSALARAVARIVRRTDVEDILQEAFVRSFEAGQRSDIRDMRAFLMRTATNLALNHAARKEHRSTGPLEELAVDDEPRAHDVPLDAQIDADREFLAFCHAVGSLPEQCRRVFILRKVYGLSQQEIASEIGISESTVEKHIAKGLMMCRERLAAPATGTATPSPLGTRRQA
jgi:RNA polymerase sigma factor (sigma-70 family)